MRTAVITTLWTGLAGLMSLTAGASLFGILAYMLSNPGTRPASWWGWNALHYTFAVGLPLTVCALTVALGVLRKLPGTRDASRADAGGHG